MSHCTLKLGGARVRDAAHGFTMVELMVAMSISLVLLLALVNIYVNLSRSNDELAKTNGLIENGRVALQILENDLQHAGYWGGYLPEFDDLGATGVPGDVPTTTIPLNVCSPYSSWDTSYRFGLLAMPVQPADTLPSGSGCISTFALRPGTDVLAVRHLELCIPGSTNCAALSTTKLYFQNSTCAAESNAGTAQGGSSNTIVLGSNASTTSSAYVGVMLHLVSGTGAGQFRSISSYNGGTKTATVSTAWSVIPDGTTRYAFEFSLSTSAFPLYQRNCVGTGTPATLPITAGTQAERRQFMSNIYYVANLTHPDRPREIIPTLMRARLDVSGGVPAHLAPVSLIEGIEVLRAEVGIDSLSETGANVDFTQAVNWVDPTLKHTVSNRGDGTPDSFKRCTTAAPCSVAELMSAVTVKLWVLARSRDTSPGYSDGKTYCVGSPAADGNCPPESRIAPLNDSYKRHVFSTTVRLMNVAGRRETPFP